MRSRLSFVVLAALGCALVIGLSATAPARAATHGMALDADPAAPGVQAAHTVGGTFEIAIHATAAGSPYHGYQWLIEYPTALSWAGTVTENSNGTGLSFCAQGGGERAMAGSRVLSEGAGCAGEVGTTFLGELTRISMRCDADGTHTINLVGYSSGNQLGSSMFGAGGVTLDTSTAGIQVTCSGSGGGGGGEGDCVVASVHSGERFWCQDGRRVVMLQMDAQNIDQCDGGWAKAALEYLFLIPGRRVTLVYDQAQTNGFGEHMAAPIWRAPDGSDYNMSIVMVYVGLAKAADHGDGNRMFLDWARASQTWASVAQWNMWAPGKTYAGAC